MPILWKVLIFRYLKTAVFCTFCLVCVSIISSFQEIVNYIAKEIPYPTIIRLTLYQIPYLLPFILPISCFISAFTLFHKLSEDNQITFLKASGASQGMIKLPVLLTSATLCCINFYTCSELASICRFQTCREVANMAMNSPILLLQTLQKKENDRVFIAVGHCANRQFDHVILALKRDQVISDVAIIKTIIADIEKDVVRAYGVLMLSRFPTSLTKRNDAREYYMETLDEVLIPNITATLFARKSRMKTRTDYLPWKQLVSSSKTHIPEILRRLSIGFLCITLTYSGIVLGTYKPRFRKRTAIYYLFPSLDIILLVLGKNTTQVSAALVLFLLPQGISWIVFFIRSYRENRGYA